MAVFSSTQNTVDGSGSLLCSLGHTFSSSNYIAMTSTGDGLTNNVVMVYVTSKTTSTLTVGCRSYTGTAIGSGQTARATWHVIGYND